MGLIKALRALFRPPVVDWTPARPKPSWPETVAGMYDRDLRYLNDDVVRVVYSADREKRFVITKSKNRALYQYRFEQLQELDDDEWVTSSQDPDAFPAMWIELGNRGFSVFGTEQEAWNDMTHSPEYKLYFV